MEKNEIVKIFLDKGLMIDNASLNFFSNNELLIQQFVNFISDFKYKVKTIDINLVQEILKIKIPGVQILKSATRKNKFSVADQASFLNNRYENVKKIMNVRIDLLNLVSINKISQKSKKFSLLGIVKQKNEGSKSLILEDSTGEAEIFFSDNFSGDYNSILTDDIFGITCSNEFGRNYFVKAIWPDIPITREIKKTKNSHKCVFISITAEGNFSKLIDWLNKSTDEKSTIFIFSSNLDIYKAFINKITSLAEKFHVKDTMMLSLLGLSMFVSTSEIYKKYAEFFNVPPEATITNLLKRRNMGPCLDFDKSVYEEDPFQLTEIPDIVAISSFGENSISNYKGTNILTLKDYNSANSFLILDTKTREATKIEIS
jgi:DNA polymerase II small subunit/DNA polymerase delta subunit B